MRAIFVILMFFVGGLTGITISLTGKVNALEGDLSAYTEWRPIDELMSPDPVLIRDGNNDIMGIYRRLNYPLTEGLETTFWLDIQGLGDIVQLPEAASYVSVVPNLYGDTVDVR